MKKYFENFLNLFARHKNIITFVFVAFLILIICASLIYIFFVNKELANNSNATDSSTTTTTLVEGRSESEHFILTDQSIGGVQLK